MYELFFTAIQQSKSKSYLIFRMLSVPFYSQLHWNIRLVFWRDYKTKSFKALMSKARPVEKIRHARPCAVAPHTFPFGKQLCHPQWCWLSTNADPKPRNAPLHQTLIACHTFGLSVNQSLPGWCMAARCTAPLLREKKGEVHHTLSPTCNIN